MARFGGEIGMPIEGIAVFIPEVTELTQTANDFRDATKIGGVVLRHGDQLADVSIDKFERLRALGGKILDSGIPHFEDGYCACADAEDQ